MSRTHDAGDVVRRSARMVVIMCDQHECEDPRECQDVNHRRDINLSKYCLQMLGLMPE